jgi:hypothetical protein
VVADFQAFVSFVLGLLQDPSVPTVNYQAGPLACGFGKIPGDLAALPTVIVFNMYIWSAANVLAAPF